MQLGVLTHACFAMLKPEKLTASFENRSSILLSLQLPSLRRGDADNTYHPADGKNAAGRFLCLPHPAVGGRTVTALPGQCLCSKPCSFTRR